MPAPETVFMFSGQGSQYFHMGRELLEKSETFRGWMTRLDAVARQVSGNSVMESLYSDARKKSDPFDRTLLTHPAIFMVEYSLASALIDAGVIPDLVLGVSMGSFAAAAVSGWIDVEDALRAVIRQAMALEEHSEPGGMTAILGDPALFAEDFLGGRSELAAVNFSSHFVISARRTQLTEIEAVLTERNVPHQRLPVRFPFHSQWIDEAKAPFASYMTSIRYRQGRWPLICCDQGTMLPDLDEDYFWNVVRRPIRFRETTARLEQERARRYIDVGPAGTLATFLKYTLPSISRSTVHAILTPFGADQKNFSSVLSFAFN